MARADITRAEQRKIREDWRDPDVDSVVATFLYRRVGPGVLDGVRWFTTKRLKGAEKNQFQAHHGGFVKVTDEDIFAAACREVREELGYVLREDDLQLLGIFGPALYRSECVCAGGGVTLTVSRDEAEPEVAFTLPLFLCDVTGLPEPTGETDGEVKMLPSSWLTGREIIGRWGQKGERPHSQFNYFQFLLPALLAVSGKWRVGMSPVFAPGVYRYTF